MEDCSILVLHYFIVGLAQMDERILSGDLRAELTIFKILSLFWNFIGLFLQCMVEFGIVYI